MCITCTVPVPPSTAMLVSDAMRAEIDGREDRAKAEAAQQARDAAAATAAIEAERDAAAAAAAAMLATPTHDFASMAGGGLVKPCAFSNHRCNCSRGVVWCVCVRRAPYINADVRALSMAPLNSQAPGILEQERH